MTTKEFAQAAHTSTTTTPSVALTVTRPHHQGESNTSINQSESLSSIANTLTISTNPSLSPSTTPLLIAQIPQLRRSRGLGATITSTSFGKKGKIHRGPPPPSMITRGHCASTSPVRIWVSQQSITIKNDALANHDYSNDSSNSLSPSLSRAIRRRSQISSVIPLQLLSPVAAEMSLCPSEQDKQESYDESTNDQGDLFLRAAHEEELARINHAKDFKFPNISTKPRLKYTTNLENTSQISAQNRFREYHCEEVVVSPTVTRTEPYGRALTFASLKNNELIAQNNKNISDSRGFKNNSMPSTPKGNYADESPSHVHSAISDRRLSTQHILQNKYAGKASSISEKLQHAYDEARNSSSEINLPVRKGYRHSSGKPPTPRRYNSSPLVPRTIALHDSPGGIQLREDTTASTVSTTAQSAVWDELEDLKSRIQRLELSGKLPPGSGTPFSRSLNDRPPTATTTVTSMSTSPKHDRAKSRSPTPQLLSEAYTGSEVNRLLKSALIKSKPTLSPEIYKSLEATASDAISIALMMGSSGQMGPISNSQSSSNSFPTVSDRQVRRKAESMLRSLTELCLVLSECNTQTSNLVDDRLALETTNTQMQLTSPRSSLIKSSPRTLTRLEARRSSLLLPSPGSRVAMAQSENSAQSNPPSGRRTSLYLRNAQQGSEDSPGSRLRLPSRSYSEFNSIRIPTRDRASQLSFSEKSANTTSSLPLRRHHTSISTTPTTPLPINSLGDRRKIELLSPDLNQRNHIFVHKQRISSLGHPLGFEPSNHSRRIRHPSAAEYSSAGRNLNFN